MTIIKLIKLQKQELGSLRRNEIGHCFEDTKTTLNTYESKDMGKDSKIRCSAQGNAIKTVRSEAAQRLAFPFFLRANTFRKPSFAVFTKQAQEKKMHRSVKKQN